MSIFEELVIENRNITVSKYSPTVGDYTVHNDKLWRVVAYAGPAIGNCKTLERQKTCERVNVSNMVKLRKVERPTGYIDI